MRFNPDDEPANEVWTVIRQTPEYVIYHCRSLGITRMTSADGSCVIDLARTRTDLQDFYLSLWELERYIAAMENQHE